MEVLVTLTSYGDAVGPFDISYGYFSSADTLIVSDVTIEELLAGYPVTVPNNIDYIVVCNLDPYSGGNCEYIYFVQYLLTTESDLDIQSEGSDSLLIDYI